MFRDVVRSNVILAWVLLSADMETFATPYPLIFFDGEKEIDKGVVGIHSCLSFKRFVAMVGQKAGHPPASLSTVLVCRKSTGSGDKKQKLPVNEHTNFSIILNQHNSMKERDCHFLVTFKKSKKERRVAKKKVETSASDPDDSMSVTASSCPSSPKGSPDSRSVADMEEEPAEKRDLSSTAASQVIPPKPAEQTKVRVAATRVSPDPPAVLPPAPPPVSAWKTGSVVDKIKGSSTRPTDVPPRHPEPHTGSSGPADVIISATGTNNPMVLRPADSSKDSSLPQPMDREVSAPAPAMNPQAAAAAVSSRAVGAPVRPDAKITAEAVAAATAAASAAVESFSKTNGGMAVTGHREAGFSLFGPDSSTSALRTMLQEVVQVDVGQFGRRKWCKFCAFCRERRLTSVPFHWCVDDQVIEGFRGPSPAGPIGRRSLKQRYAVVA